MVYPSSPSPLMTLLFAMEAKIGKPTQNTLIYALMFYSTIYFSPIVWKHCPIKSTLKTPIQYQGYSAIVSHPIFFLYLLKLSKLCIQSRLYSIGIRSLDVTPCIFFSPATL